MECNDAIGECTECLIVKIGYIVNVKTYVLDSVFTLDFILKKCNFVY